MKKKNVDYNDYHDNILCIFYSRNNEIEIQLKQIKIVKVNN